MSEQVPQPWEVWHARFDYASGRGYKYRPVIVLATRPDGSLVAMVTGAGNKLTLEHDYSIREWEAAGLDKPSTARLDRIAKVPAGSLALRAASAASPIPTSPPSRRYSPSSPPSMV